MFVGNIPFQCDPFDFWKCFENYDGFIKAELMYKPNSTLTRGFGFVLFDKQYNAHKLLGEKCLKFNNRVLRLIEYSGDKKNNLVNTINEMA